MTALVRRRSAGGASEVSTHPPDRPRGRRRLAARRADAVPPGEGVRAGGPAVSNAARGGRDRRDVARRRPPPGSDRPRAGALARRPPGSACGARREPARRGRRPQARLPAPDHRRRFRRRAATPRRGAVRARHRARARLPPPPRARRAAPGRARGAHARREARRRARPGAPARGRRPRLLALAARRDLVGARGRGRRPRARDLQRDPRWRGHRAAAGRCATPVPGHDAPLRPRTGRRRRTRRPAPVGVRRRRPRVRSARSRRPPARWAGMPPARWRTST
jgi:hypothetical protein